MSSCCSHPSRRLRDYYPDRQDLDLMLEDALAYDLSPWGIEFIRKVQSSPRMSGLEAPWSDREDRILRELAGPDD